MKSRERRLGTHKELRHSFDDVLRDRRLELLSHTYAHLTSARRRRS